jgi:hypothetical protein
MTEGTHHLLCKVASSDGLSLRALLTLIRTKSHRGNRVQANTARQAGKTDCPTRRINDALGCNACEALGTPASAVTGTARSHLFVPGLSAIRRQCGSNADDD